MGKYTKKYDLERIWRDFQEQTGQEDVDMDALADFCERVGFDMPEPISSRTLLKRQLTRAARHAKKRDEVTGIPYRAYLQVKEPLGQGVLNIWRETDNAPRAFVEKSLKEHDDHVVGVLSLSVGTADHWNRIHPHEKPVEVNTNHDLAVQIALLASDILDEDEED